MLALNQFSTAADKIRFHRTLRLKKSFQYKYLFNVRLYGCSYGGDVRCVQRAQSLAAERHSFVPLRS